MIVLERIEIRLLNPNILAEYIGLTLMFSEYRILVLGYSQILIVASLIYACVTLTSQSQTSAQPHPASDISVN